MMLNLIDKIGDWNPQLLRELKGRLKILPVAIALIISLLGQLVLFLFQLKDFPGENYSIVGQYCRLSKSYLQQQETLYRQSSTLNTAISSLKRNKGFDKASLLDLQTELKSTNVKLQALSKYISENFCPTNQLDMQSWWQDHWEYIFLSLSVIFIFTLLVAGTYLLINNLANEERRGTLNFIRLSPQSEVKILTGKLLGVPILVYLVTLVAVPLHLYAGRSANIALSYIFSFYAVLAASCIFFYSAALLFGLVCRWFNSFQPWLGSGSILVFLIMTMMMVSSSGGNFNNSTAWFRLFSPFDITNYLFPNLFHLYNGSPLKQLQFFYLPIGTNVSSIVGFHLLSYGLCTFGIWQALKRCFRNPNTAVISKLQSYLVVAGLQVMMWGFTLHYVKNYCPPTLVKQPSTCLYDVNSQIGENFILLAFCNSVLLLGLIAILSPHRQAVQDWARYKHQGIWNKSLLKDLIFGEKSIALVAMAINLAIAIIPLIVWIAVAPILNVHHNRNLLGFGNNVHRIHVIFALALFITFMMIYATIAQLMLMMKTSKRSLWAIGTVAAVMFLPPMILQFLTISPSKNATLWLFSSFPWAGVEYASTTTIFLALLTEFSVLALLNFQLTKRVKLAGESATKALLS
ncbi:ABC transporter permease [Hassallia byssoidea VB512170]|uniref:ABC transporter permease n=1 Tax=Hassallia byssoidea VB512170 TaxID=1304833 RepID=A0A846HIF3_9CYAN|nr:ABC transporter permease subunit [Hassalia byssoidea]NEU76728.1 ABC transporter permease [Hassalia byssoidea VB512170]